MEPGAALEEINGLHERARDFVRDEYALVASIHVLTTGITDDEFSLDALVAGYEDEEAQDTARQTVSVLLSNEHLVVAHAAVLTWASFEAFCMDCFGVLQLAF